MATAKLASHLPSTQHPSQSSVKEILEHVDLYWVEGGPLPTSDIATLYDTDKDYSQVALADYQSPDGDFFTQRLAGLKECIRASKTGKLNLPMPEMKRAISVYAAALFREIREHTEAERGLRENEAS